MMNPAVQGGEEARGARDRAAGSSSFPQSLFHHLELAPLRATQRYRTPKSYFSSMSANKEKESKEYLKNKKYLNTLIDFIDPFTTNSNI